MRRVDVACDLSSSLKFRFRRWSPIYHCSTHLKFTDDFVRRAKYLEHLASTAMVQVHPTLAPSRGPQHPFHVLLRRFPASREKRCIVTHSGTLTRCFWVARESKHPQYSSWTAAVVRCDETEERGGDHWAGGCPFLNYGGFTWHLRYVRHKLRLLKQSVRG